MRGLTSFAALALGIATSSAMGGARGLPEGPNYGRGGAGKRKHYPAEHYQANDPFYGIQARGRRSAGRRMRAMESARLARRKARDAGLPKLGNPFKHDARRKAFDAAVKALSAIARNPDWVRAQAMKSARRVPA